MNFTFKITDFQPQIKQGENVTIEVFTDEEYDKGIQVVAIGKVRPGEIKDMTETILGTAPKFLVRWSEQAAYSQWKTLQSPSAYDFYNTRNFGFESDRTKPLSVLVNRC